MGLASCNNGGTIKYDTTTESYPPNPTNIMPNGYLCLPQLPSSATKGVEHSFQIAYGENCQVSVLKALIVKENTSKHGSSIKLWT